MGTVPQDPWAKLPVSPRGRSWCGLGVTPELKRRSHGCGHTNTLPMLLQPFLPVLPTSKCTDKQRGCWLLKSPGTLELTPLAHLARSISSVPQGGQTNAIKVYYFIWNSQRLSHNVVSKRYMEISFNCHRLQPLLGMNPTLLLSKKPLARLTITSSSEG